MAVPADMTCDVGVSAAKANRAFVLALDRVSSEV
jgi:hypothetical protein